MPYNIPADDTDEYTTLTLTDGKEWSSAVKDGLENANWHDPLEAFAHMIELLPEVYEALSFCGFHGLAKRLEGSTKKWNQYF